MERDGLIRGEWRKLPNGQERRYYYMTAEGKQALAEKLTTWGKFSMAVNLIVKPAEV